MTLPRLSVQRLSGAEPFHLAGESSVGSVLDFWQWACSDLVTNTFRGWLAEYIVTRALDVPDGVRHDWLPYDLTDENGIKIEVKTSGYVQSWHQAKLSTPRFDIARKRGWDPDTDTLTEVPERHSDVYVFCLLKHREQATLDPLDLGQWEFYVLSTHLINQELGSQKSLGVITLRNLGAVPVGFQEIRSAVVQAAEHA